MKRIVLQNFGPIKYVDLDLNKNFYTLIGAQATGKSTIVKCIYLAKHVVELFPQYLSDWGYYGERSNSNFVVEEYKKKIQEIYKGIFSGKLYKNCNIIYYYTDTEYLEIFITEKGRVKISYSDNLELLLQEVTSKWFKAYGEMTPDNFPDFFGKLLSFQKELKYYISSKLNEYGSLVYIPACRSNLMFSLKKSQMDYITEKFIEEIDSYKAFVDRDSFGDIVEFRRQKDSKFALLFDELRELSFKILKGSYKAKEDEEFIEIADDVSVPLLYCSSGQQEALWIVNMLAYSLVANRQTNFIIEEPESHLYPDGQYDIIKLISLVANATGGKVFVTTHSPYILATINLLMYSGLVEKNCKEDAVVDNIFQINPDFVDAYEIHEGKAKSLYAADEKLLHIERIDGIASVINMLFDKIMGKQIE